MTVAELISKTWIQTQFVFKYVLMGIVLIYWLEQQTYEQKIPGCPSLLQNQYSMTRQIKLKTDGRA